MPTEKTAVKRNPAAGSSKSMTTKLERCSSRERESARSNLRSTAEDGPSRSLQSASHQLAWVRGRRHQMVCSVRRAKVFGGTPKTTGVTPVLPKIDCTVPAKHTASFLFEYVSLHCLVRSDDFAAADIQHPTSKSLCFRLRRAEKCPRQRSLPITGRLGLGIWSFKPPPPDSPMYRSRRC